MEEQSGKRRLLDALLAERARWEALLAEVGEERMTLSGVIGEWSIKDIIAHLTAWERQPVAWLDAVQCATTPQPPDWDTRLNEEQINAWVFQSNHARPLREVIAESRQVFDRLVELLRSTSEQDLTKRIEWLDGDTLSESIPGDSHEHYRDHAAAIRAWLGDLNA